MKYQVRLQKQAQRRAVLTQARRSSGKNGRQSREDLEARVTKLEEAIEALVEHLGLREESQ